MGTEMVAQRPRLHWHFGNKRGMTLNEIVTSDASNQALQRKYFRELNAFILQTVIYCVKELRKQENDEKGNMIRAPIDKWKWQDEIHAENALEGSMSTGIHFL